MHGLQRLEYRGYDSAGMAIGDETHIRLTKAVGKVANLWIKIEKDTTIWWNRWIAHTRWATHGWVTETNCHPHVSNDGSIYVVHNWIIENYAKLRGELHDKWYTFSSETDTEVVANLIQDLRTWDLWETIDLAVQKCRWAYALVVMHRDVPDSLVGIKLWSPLIFAYDTNNNFFFSSDAQALSGYVDKMIYLEEWDSVIVSWWDYAIHADWKLATRDIETFNQEALVASKWSYKHFMLKEIEEQPNIVRRIFKWRLSSDTFNLHSDAYHGMQKEKYRFVTFVACGTSHYAWCLASYWFEDLALIQTKNEIASEYENKTMHTDHQTLHIFISQSWETADSIACLRLLQEQWANTFGVVNVPGSTIARLTDSGLYTRAGTEIGVASTKAFTAQTVCLLLTSLYLAKKRWLRYAIYQNIVRELLQLPTYIETVIQQWEIIQSIATQLATYKNFFFLWRHYHVPIAAEAALKFKEITYLHAESYPAGELKHGPLALIDADTPSILFMPHDLMFEKNLSTLQEIKARNGKVLVISDKKVDWATWQITIPTSTPEIYPLITNVVGQLLAYHTADILNNDIDKPRNLAKSVTVK